MAILVPSIDQINRFPKPLEAGEQALMNALCAILDDDWTIYVQPFLNGLQPDILIFSEKAGLGIFEVKDWNLAHYRVRRDGAWEVYDGRQQKRHATVKRCPLRQVQRYKDNIVKYELPELQAESVLNPNVYGLVVPFVYFHNHTTAEAKAKIAPIEKDNPYVTVFGNDALDSNSLRGLLNSRRLHRGSQFTALMPD